LKIISKKDNNNIKKSLEYKTLKPIKQKLIDNNLTIYRADKGKPIVIIANEALHNKVLAFTNENHLKRLKKMLRWIFKRKLKKK
jgi:hypothetical protein